MIDLRQIFNAGRVRRWHHCPELSWSDDYNDGHQGRVARIILALHPKPSIKLLAAALSHDDGELAAGDMGRDAKRENPELREMLRRVENASYRAMWNVEPHVQWLTDDEKDWLRFADSLDAYMWMQHKQPNLDNRDDWVAASMSLVEFAMEKGIISEITAALR